MAAGDQGANDRRSLAAAPAGGARARANPAFARTRQFRDDDRRQRGTRRHWSEGAGRLAEIMRRGLSFDAQSLANPDSMLTYLGNDAISALTILLPIFGTLIVLVLLAAVALGGWNFSPQALIPDFSRMNPLEGVKRLFG
jgi:hypothetical protein